MVKLNPNQVDDQLQSHAFVLLDFSSPGCAPCKKVPPLIAEVLSETSGLDVAAFEVNIAEDQASAQRFFVLGVPTVIVFKQGREVGRFNSIPNKDKLKKLLV
jgi:thioredoxin 1